MTGIATLEILAHEVVQRVADDRGDQNSPLPVSEVARLRRATAGAVRCPAAASNGGSAAAGQRSCLVRLAAEDLVQTLVPNVGAADEIENREPPANVVRLAEALAQPLGRDADLFRLHRAAGGSQHVVHFSRGISFSRAAREFAAIRASAAASCGRSASRSTCFVLLSRIAFCRSSGIRTARRFPRRWPRAWARPSTAASISSLAISIAINTSYSASDASEPMPTLNPCDGVTPRYVWCSMSHRWLN